MSTLVSEIDPEVDFLALRNISIAFGVIEHIFMDLIGLFNGSIVLVVSTINIIWSKI